MEKIICALGVFDGVHLGHQKILEEVIKLASKEKAKSIVITFETHPKKIISPDSSPSLLTTTEEKIKLIKKFKIDKVIVINFTESFSKITPEDFIKRFLVEKFKINFVVVGKNYFFGRNKKGDINLLKNFASKYGFIVKAIGYIKLNGITISSSKIRKALENGDIESANKMLGRNYEIEGIVTKGENIGRTIGFPTANIKPFHEAIPGSGVYAVRIKVESKIYRGMCNIGFKGIEAHIFDFKKNIYCRRIRIEFLKKIRNEKNFSNKDELLTQIKKDKKKCTSYRWISRF